MLKVNYRENRKKISKITLWSCILGHGLEIYDFTLYGAFLISINLHFFSNKNFFLALLALSIGYVARPFGAVLFGYIGDLYGRKKSLIFTMSLTSLATIAIGLCPSYESIGFLASFVLFLSRSIQGLCAGAETSNSSVFLIEHCTVNHSSYGSSMIFFSGGIGCLIALLISKIFLNIDLIWAWRIPFIFGFIFGCIIVFLRFKVKESLTAKGSYSISKIFYKLTKDYNLELIKTFSCGLLSGITSTTIIVFVPIFLNKVLDIKIDNALTFSIFGLSSFLCACLICSKIASTVNRNKVIMFALIGLVLWSIPYFYLISQKLTFFIITAQVILGFFSGFFIAPMKSLLSQLFPTNIRCTGISLGYNTGYAITSGLYPIAALKLIKVTGNIYSPAVFLLFFALLTLFILRTELLANHNKCND